MNILRRLFAPSVSAYDLAKKHKTELYLDPFLAAAQFAQTRFAAQRTCHQSDLLHWSAQRNAADAIRLVHPIHGHDDIANAIAGAADARLQLHFIRHRPGASLMGRMKPTPSASSTSLMTTFAGGWATTCGALVQVGS